MPTTRTPTRSAGSPSVSGRRTSRATAASSASGTWSWSPSELRPDERLGDEASRVLTGVRVLGARLELADPDDDGLRRRVDEHQLTAEALGGVRVGRQARHRLADGRLGLAGR